MAKTPKEPATEVDPLFKRLRTLLSEQLGVDEDEVTTDSTLVDDLGADSLDVVELVIAVESEFKMEIPDEDADRLSSVGGLLAYIKKHQPVTQG